MSDSNVSVSPVRFFVDPLLPDKQALREIKACLRQIKAYMGQEFEKSASVTAASL